MIELWCEYLHVRFIWLYVINMSRTSFRVDPHIIVCLNVKKLLAQSRRHIWGLSDSNEIRTHNQLLRKSKFNHLAKQPKWLICVVSTDLCGSFDCFFYHITYGFPSESTVHSLLQCQGSPCWCRCHIWGLSDSNEIATLSHLVRKWTTNHLEKLSKWMAYVLNTYLYDAFDYMLSPHVRVSE